MRAGELFTRRRLNRAARYVAYGAVLLVVAVVAAALVAPEFLNRPRVGAELRARLSRMVQGQVEWERLGIGLLPRPRAELRRVKVEIGTTASVRAEQADVYLRLLPLLRGRAEIASVSLSGPVVRVDLGPSPPGKARAAPVDAADAYRSAVEIVRRFAPKSEIDVENADIGVRVPGIPPIRLRDLAARARTTSEGIEFELTAAGDIWSRVELSGRVAFTDFSGRADLELAGLEPQAWLDFFLGKAPVGVAVPTANLRAQLRTDGRTNLECDFELQAPSVGVSRGAERLAVPGVSANGTVVVRPGELDGRLSAVGLGASRLADGSWRYSPADRSFEAGAEFDADLAQALDATRRFVPQKTRAALARLEPASGRAQGRATLTAGRSGWNVVVQVRKSDSSFGIQGAPGPIKMAGGSVSITRDAVRIDRAEVSVLDSSMIASATIGYRGRIQVAGSVPQGSVGEELLGWIWQTARLPPRAMLKAPIRIAMKGFAWSPGRPLAVDATALFEAGPSIAVALEWAPGTLDIRRAAIRDARSDVVIALRRTGRALDGSFSGSLSSASIAGMLKNGTLPSGSASGDIRFSFDREQTEPISARGRLKGDGIDLSWLVGRPAKVEHLRLEADERSLRILEAEASWAGQIVKLAGEITRGASGPVINAQLDSPGVIVEALMPPADESAKGQSPAGEESAEPPATKREARTLWPLPVTGRIVVRSDFVQYAHYRAANVAATLALEKQSARLELQRAELCGIFPQLSVEDTPAGFTVAGRVSARKQQLEQTARCLTDRGLLITGDFDLSADFNTHGEPGQLLRNLAGKIGVEARKGRVMKFALLGNILSLKNISDQLAKEGPRLDETGFPYRSLTLKGRFQGGKFLVDESAFDSDAVGLAARGWISLVDLDSRLSVLVAPFSRLNRFARGVPIVGYVIGGTLTSIPVGVSGDIRNPLVVPLGPGAITSELMGIFQRTVKLPTRLIPGQGGEAPVQSPSGTQGPREGSP